MKFVALSDWCAESGGYLLEVLAKEQPDFIVHAGDCLNNFDDEYLNELIVKTKRRQFLYVLGNHDLGESERLSAMPGAVNLHLNAFEVGGFDFVGCGGINKETLYEKYRGRWDFFDDSLIENELSLLFQGRKNPSVLVTHDPPYRTLDYSLSAGHIGSKALREFLVHHDVCLHVFGHSHFCGGMRTAFSKSNLINVASTEYSEEDLRFCVVTLDNDLADFKFDSLPKENRKRSLYMGRVSNIKDKEHLYNVSPVLDVKKGSGRNSVHLNSRKFFSVVDCIDRLLPYGRLTSTDARYLRERIDYEGRTNALVEYLDKNFNPWPTGIGLKTMVVMFEHNFRISSRNIDYEKLLSIIPQNMKRHAQRYILSRIAKEKGKVVFDPEVSSKLKCLDPLFLSLKWVPQINRILACSYCLSSGGASDCDFTAIQDVNAFLKEEGCSRNGLVHYGLRGIKNLLGIKYGVDLLGIAKQFVGVPNDDFSKYSLDQQINAVCGEKAGVLPIDSKFQNLLGINLYLNGFKNIELYEIFRENCASEVNFSSTLYGFLERVRGYEGEDFVICKCDLKNNKVFA